MRVLVTGGAGFLGSHIVDELSRRGHSATVFDKISSPWLHDEQLMVVADIRDRSALRVALQGCDAVFHCAAVADLECARTDPVTAVDVNVHGTLAVLEEAAAANVRHFMLASSVYVFSRAGSVYRTTKQAAENLVRDLAGDLDIRFTILRFGSLYGPRADPNNAILRLATQAIYERQIDFWGDGSEVREYIHIRDAAALAVDALNPEYAEQSLLITGRERVTTSDMLGTIREILGEDVAVHLTDTPFEGRYRLTPYALDNGVSQRLTRPTYVDLGLGLLEVLNQVKVERDANAEGSS